jgi:DNA replication factor GINS
MELNYDEIRRIYRLEKNTSKLVEVQEDFFDSLTEFISKEKENYFNSMKELDFQKARSFSNLKKMVEEILSLREKKILSKALVASKTSEVNNDLMAVEERKMFNSMLKILNSHNQLIQSIFIEDKKPSQEKDLNKVSVKILSDIPSFIGTDMKEYGPFKKNETVKLPSKIAKLFFSRKIGVKVD